MLLTAMEENGFRRLLVKNLYPARAWIAKRIATQYLALVGHT
jgi:hypothetical protein